MMETSVLIQVPYELEKVYSPLEERNDIDYVVMPVDNFNVSDFLMGVYFEWNPLSRRSGCHVQH